MATIDAIKVPSVEVSTVRAKWLALQNGDTGSAVDMNGRNDRSVQVTGTFGAGGTVVIEGTIDGVNYYTLTDPQGNALSITQAKIEAITELVLSIRPRVTVGDSNTLLDVWVLFGRNSR